jgi:hypothetical protein
MVAVMVAAAAAGAAILAASRRYTARLCERVACRERKQNGEAEQGGAARVHDLLP